MNEQQGYNTKLLLQLRRWSGASIYGRVQDRCGLVKGSQQRKAEASR